MILSREQLLFWPVTLVSAIMLGLTGGPLVWHLKGETGKLAPVPHAIAATDVAEIPVSRILALAPFGSVAATAASPSAPAVESTLGLTLMGVMIGDEPSRSRAIITGKSGTSRGYGIGELVTSDVTLVAVHPTNVVLVVNDQKQILSFPKPLEVAGAASLSANVLGGASAVGAPSTPDPDTVIAAYRAKIEANPKQVLDDIGLEATPDGYRIAAQHNVGVDRAGLQTGDVVKTVNGQQVGNIETDRDLYDKVAASGRARLEILRGDQKIIMTFPLR